jgi:hypothetical protein
VPSNHSLYPGLASEYVLAARNFHPSEYEIAAFKRDSRGGSAAAA